ncbi:hypothetical protein V8C37DRAFT_190359 [Trichoderma ceciliae]
MDYYVLLMSRSFFLMREMTTPLFIAYSHFLAFLFIEEAGYSQGGDQARYEDAKTRRIRKLLVLRPARKLMRFMGYINCMCVLCGMASVCWDYQRNLMSVQIVNPLGLFAFFCLLHSRYSIYTPYFTTKRIRVSMHVCVSKACHSTVLPSRSPQLHPQTAARIMALIQFKGGPSFELIAVCIYISPACRPKPTFHWLPLPARTVGRV